MRTSRLAVLVLGSVFLSGGLAFGQARLGPYVVDSTGLKVGHVYDSYRIFLFVDGEGRLIEAGRSGFTPLNVFVYFSTADCSGTQYILADNSDYLFSGVPITFTSDGFLHYSSTASGSSVVVQSGREINPDGSLGSCGVATGSWFVAPAITIPSNFTPPFSVVDALPVTSAPGTATFNDVPTSHPFFQFIEALYASGITAGCQAAPPLYCPDNPVTRGQMAAFIAKALGL